MFNTENFSEIQTFFTYPRYKAISEDNKVYAELLEIPKEKIFVYIKKVVNYNERTTHPVISSADKKDKIDRFIKILPYNVYDINLYDENFNLVENVNLKYKIVFGVDEEQYELLKQAIKISYLNPQQQSWEFTEYKQNFVEPKNYSITTNSDIETYSDKFGLYTVIAKILTNQDVSDITVYPNSLGYNLIGFQHSFAIRYQFNFYPQEVKKLAEEELQKINQYKKGLLQEYTEQKNELQKLKKEQEKQQYITTKLLYAKSLIEEKNYSKAKDVIQEVLKLDPENFQAKEMLYLVNKYLDKSTISYLYALATDAYEKGNYDLAIERLNKLLEIDNTNKKAIVLLKFCNVQKLILEKKYNDAKSELFEILKLEPDNSSALDLLKKVDTLIEIGE
jgi:tetratricopeptide (TPR) repeat protein